MWLKSISILFKEYATWYNFILSYVYIYILKLVSCTIFYIIQYNKTLEFNMSSNLVL